MFKPEIFKSLFGSPFTESELRHMGGPVPAVYILYSGSDPNRAIQYVGQTQHLKARLDRHRKDGREFDAAEFVIIEDKADRLRLEGVLILILLPIQNKGIHLGVSPTNVWELTWTLGRQRKTNTKGPKRSRSKG